MHQKLRGHGAVGGIANRPGPIPAPLLGQRPGSSGLLGTYGSNSNSPVAVATRPTTQQSRALPDPSSSVSLGLFNQPHQSRPPPAAGALLATPGAGGRGDDADARSGRDDVGEVQPAAERRAVQRADERGVPPTTGGRTVEAHEPGGYNQAENRRDCPFRAERVRSVRSARDDRLRLPLRRSPTSGTTAETIGQSPAPLRIAAADQRHRRAARDGVETQRL